MNENCDAYMGHAFCCLIIELMLCIQRYYPSRILLGSILLLERSTMWSGRVTGQKCSFSVRGNLHVSLSPAARYRSANRTQFHRCSFDHRSSAPRMVSSSRMKAGGRLSTAPRMQAKSAWGPPTAGVPIICPSTGEYKWDDMVDASKSRCRMLRLPQIDEY